MVCFHHQLLAVSGLLASSYAWNPTANPNRMLKARQDCTAPCGNYNQWYTPLCCSDNWICITDVFSSAKCGPVPTVATVQTTLVETNTVTATPTVQSTDRSTSTPTSRPVPTATPTRTPTSTSATQPTARADTVAESDNEWPKKKIIAVSAGGGGGALIVLAAAVGFFIWHKKHKTHSRDGTDRDGAGSMMARVSPRVQSRQELREMRDEAAEEVAPPRYDNAAPNPFTSAAFKQMRSNTPSQVDRRSSPGLFNELPATARSTNGESERLLPRRAVGGGAARHSNIGPVPQPPPPRSSRGAPLRPDHDFSAGR